jgi:hypothetical protein
VDVQLVAKDDGRIHVHKAILVRLVCLIAQNFDVVALVGLCV